MICRVCGERYDLRRHAACPNCEAVRKPVSGSIRTSTVFVATREAEGVYRSIDAVPEPIRKRILQSTRNMQSATILIADKGGRERLKEVLGSTHETLPEAPQRELPPMIQWPLNAAKRYPFLVAAATGFAAGILLFLWFVSR